MCRSLSVRCRCWFRGAVNVSPTPGTLASISANTSEYVEVTIDLSGLSARPTGGYWDIQFDDELTDPVYLIAVVDGTSLDTTTGQITDGSETEYYESNNFLSSSLFDEPAEIVDSATITGQADLQGLELLVDKNPDGTDTTDNSVPRIAWGNTAVTGGLAAIVYNAGTAAGAYDITVKASPDTDYDNTNAFSFGTINLSSGTTALGVY